MIRRSGQSNKFASRTAVVWVAVLTIGLFACATDDGDIGADTGETGSEFSQGETRDTSVADTTVAGSDLDLGVVYFDYDRYEIRQDARTLLKSDADGIMGGRSTVTVEGHTDERGDEEYNLALGERRANAVKKYLVNLGVPSSKLRIVSYGETKPAVQGHDEAAWRWNRRAEFRGSN